MITPKQLKESIKKAEEANVVGFLNDRDKKHEEAKKKQIEKCKKCDKECCPKNPNNPLTHGKEPDTYIDQSPMQI